MHQNADIDLDVDTDSDSDSDSEVDTDIDADKIEPQSTGGCLGRKQRNVNWSNAYP